MSYKFNGGIFGARNSKSGKLLIVTGLRPQSLLEY